MKVQQAENNKCFIFDKGDAIRILDSVQPNKDKFELDDKNFGLAFPCNVCVHRHGTDRDEPCISCGHNLRSEEVDNEM